MAISDDELDACIRVLEALCENRSQLADLNETKSRRLLMAAGVVSRPDRSARKQLAKVMRRRDRAAVRAHDAKVVSTSLNRTARRSSSFVLPGSTVLPGSVPLFPEDAPRELLRPRSCYICKTEYRRVHPFYDSMCPPCAELNLEKRNQTARLDGRHALITGARIKIGYQAALMLLRAGATVLATTRFPRDAAARYAEEPDFAVWRDRLHVYGIDLRMAPEVEHFAQTLCGTLPRLDILVNNAAQTVRRPAAFYQHLVEEEARPLPPNLQRLLSAPAPPSALAARSAKEDADFPLGQLDLDKQQVDLRTVNSWRLTLSEVPTSELLEVQLVNAVAPFILVSKLKPLMVRDRTDEKHVINVSAMEAQFSRNKKTDKHPHTNMAKAALNMMTRTSAIDYVRDGIFMNSVDTGWVTDEDPLQHATRKQVEHDFHPPLDAIDGAARVLDPLFTGLNTGKHPWGLFWKDYRPVSW